MSEVGADERVCWLRQSGARWLSTGVGGGYVGADTACNLTVPTDFDRRDLGEYVASRRAAAGLDPTGPALLTAVAQSHARAARADGVTVVATAGLSNPATLPVSDGEVANAYPGEDTGGRRPGDSSPKDESPPVGTVNLLVATTRSLDDAALAGGLATAVEAKAATLQARTGFTGTTSDAIAIGCDPDGEEATFVGSSTVVGEAIRACVRDAVRASLASYYAERDRPGTVAEAEHGVETTRSTTVFEP